MLFGRRMISLASAASVLLSAVAQSQSNPTTSAPAANWRYPGRLLGVYDAATGNPIEGAEVIDVLSDATVRTPASGLITFGFLPEGRSLVRIRKVGYTGDTLFVSITPRDTAPITIVLNRLTDLAAVMITDSAPRYRSPNLRAFEERRRTMPGYFITEAQLRKDDGRKLGNELSKIPGLAVNGRDGGVRSTRGGCAPDVFIDGIKQQRGGRGMPTIGQMEVSEVGAIEYYTVGQLPAQFNMIGSACGAIIIWTRER